MIEWVRVEPGRAEIGSQNRSILFGGIGPKHMVDLKYAYEISKNPVPAGEAEALIEAKEAGLSSESEWAVALTQGAITGSGELEKLSDRCKGTYWGKSLDGRPQWMGDWQFRICKQWKDSTPSTRLVAREARQPEFSRLVRIEMIREYDPDAPTLPANRDTGRLLREESSIILGFGIVPSFVWAYFNASPGYIESGWPGLVLGGIILGLITSIFWRPKTTSYRIGRNCGKVKPNE